MKVEMDYPDANGQVLTRDAQSADLGVDRAARHHHDGWLMKGDDLRLRFVALDTDGKPIRRRKVSVAPIRARCRRRGGG